VPPRRRSQPRSPFHKALGKAIEEIRQEAGLTVEELADRADMRFQLVSDLERGITNPVLTTLVRVAGGLEVELSQLIARLEKIRDTHER
jgi:transcriptional regulator with XRE-family HTH domain